MVQQIYLIGDLIEDLIDKHLIHECATHLMIK